MPSEVSAFDSDSERPPERAAMERALDLARRGWGRVAPNPLVGAVVLAGDSVVAEGYHAEYGGAHAEVVALQAAGARARWRRLRTRTRRRGAALRCCAPRAWWCRSACSPRRRPR